MSLLKIGLFNRKLAYKGNDLNLSDFEFKLYGFFELNYAVVTRIVQTLF